MDPSNSDLIKSLIRCNIFKIGNFKLKSGAISPIYINLREIINDRNVIIDLMHAIRRKLEEENIKFDKICGVPFTALDMASTYSTLHGVNVLIRRKEQKEHGIKQMVQGNCDGVCCLILEDIVSSGTSVIETAEALRRAGVTVKDCIVVVNRNQGGAGNLQKKGIKLHQLFDINDIFNAYCSINRVEEDLVQKVQLYFKENSYLPVVESSSSSALSYEERSKLCTHSVAKRLFEIMKEKRTNLCVAVDTDSSHELLKLGDVLGPHICVLKTHVDVLEDFSHNVVAELTKLAALHNFLIFEDRKFADIGNTVINQFKGGIYKIQSWADIVSVHAAISGEGILEALKNERCASVLVAEMSSKGAFTSDDYKDKVFAMAEKNSDFVIGYVAQNTYPKGNFVHMCPGVNITSPGDSLGQQYKSPEEAVANGADIIIVGRGICSSPDIENSAIEYKTRAFNAYLKRIS